MDCGSNQFAEGFLRAPSGDGTWYVHRAGHALV